MTLEAEIGEMLARGMNDAPLSQADYEAGGFGAKFVALGRDERDSQLLLSLGTLADVVLRLAREIDELRGAQGV